jgi:hypothetical protein
VCWHSSVQEISAALIEFTDHAWVGPLSIWTSNMIGYIPNGAIRFDHRDNWLVAAKRS